MSGAHVKIEDAALKRELSGLIGRLTKPAPALREIGAVIRDSARARFKTETAPDGRKWAQNSYVTLMRYLEERSGSFKKKGGITAKGTRRLGIKKILTNRGYLADSLAYQLGDGGHSVVVGSNRVYAATQQFGARMGQFGRYSQVWRRDAYKEGDFRRNAGIKKGFPIPWGNIPARPFLGISPADGAAISAILRDYLSR